MTITLAQDDSTASSQAAQTRTFPPTSVGHEANRTRSTASKADCVPTAAAEPVSDAVVAPHKPVSPTTSATRAATSTRDTAVVAAVTAERDTANAKTTAAVAATEAKAHDIHAGHIVVDTATGGEAPASVSETRVKEVFGTIAPKYDSFNTVSSFGLHKCWVNAVVDTAALTPQSHMLDLAGGTGDVGYTAAKRTPPAHILLTDYVPEMLEVARERSRQGAARGVPVDFAVVDAQDIPYDDDSFDAVTMAYGIRNIPDRGRTLSEVYRVLKPGGTFVCLEFSKPINPAWRALYNLYLKVMIPFWGKLFTGDVRGFVYLADSIRAFPDQATFARMLEDAGFCDVHWKNLTGGIVAVHSGRKAS